MSEIFGAETTTDDLLDGLDLTGFHVFVTGVSSGLGLETARSFAARGARVTGAARNLGKAREALSRSPAVKLVELELASLRSVRNCADALLADGEPFDVAIANAGVMACPQGKTVDGFETQFGTNHLGHFLLINRIAPLLRQDARVVVVSSGAHHFADVDLDDPNFERTPYQEFVSYGRSKTANILFAVEFDRRHRSEGVRATALNPGAIMETELARHLTPALAGLVQASLKASEDRGAPIRFKTVRQGAATSVWAAVAASADDIGGHYCEDCDVAEVAVDEGALFGVRGYALDPDRAKALWALSEQMVGERF
jgi:NAD(P)-dependent dehydrogenase (short-subunit alcohol dehydrogenase family)